MSSAVPEAMTREQLLLRRKGRLITYLTYLLVIFMLIAVSATLVVLVLQNKRLDEQSQILVECTTPPESRTPPSTHPQPNDCYIRSKKNTTKILGDISQISIAAAACGAAHPGDVAATRKCVDATLKTGK